MFIKIAIPHYTVTLHTQSIFNIAKANQVSSVIQDFSLTLLRHL